MHSFLRHAFPLVAAVALLTGPRLAAQQITGRIVDQGSGQPMAAVQVSIPGTGIGALSQQSGRYLLLNVPVGNHTVSAQRIGYRTATAQVTVTAGGTVVHDFALSEEALGLDEIIVTGTPGGTQRRAIGNSVLSVQASEVTQTQAISSMQDLLSGRTPGLQFTQLNGNVGGGAAIQIRGVGSFSLASDPLVFVDGVRVANSSDGGPQLGSPKQVNPLNDLNPADIESVEIIKGPAAATLYGTEASAGVIQIITKRGREGTPQFDMAVSAGNIFILDPAGRIGLQWSCKDRFAPPCDEQTGGLFSYNAYDEANIALAAGVDPRWPMERLFQNGPTQSYDLSARGGTQSIRYFMSGNYSRDEGVVYYNWDKTFRLRANISTVFSQKVSFDISTGYIGGKTRFMAQANGDGGEWEDLVWGSGYCLQRISKEASCSRLPGPFQEHLPSDIARLEMTRGYSRFTGSATLNLTPTGWLTSRAIAGLDKGWDENTELWPIETELSPVYEETITGLIIEGRPVTTNLSLDWSATARYSPKAGLTTATSVGAQYYQKVLSELRNQGVGFASPASRTINQTPPAAATLFYNYIENKSLGVYVQEELGWNDRIFLTGAVRFDDNSAFGSKYEPEIYPKISATWVLSDESFWKVGLINSLRLRGAWGAAGRQPDTFAGTNQYGVISGAGGNSAFASRSAGNPTVGPERSTELELGFDVAVLNDRISGEFSWYNKKTEDALLGIGLAPSMGFSGSSQQNLGRLDSWGWEGSLSTRIYETPRLAFKVDFTADHTENEIKDLGSYPGTNNIRIGFPYPNYVNRLVVTDAAYSPTGTITDLWNQRIAANCEAGIPLGAGPKYGWLRGGASVPCASVNPGATLLFGPTYYTYRYSVGPQISLFNNALQLNALAEGAYGATNREGDSSFTYSTAYSARTERDPAFVAAKRLGGAAALQYYDAGFWKLREVAVRYNLPESLTGRIGADRASLAVSGRGLWTIWVAQATLCRPASPAGGPVPCVGELVTDPELRNSQQGGANFYLSPPTSSVSATLRVTF